MAWVVLIDIHSTKTANGKFPVHIASPKKKKKKIVVLINGYF